MLGVKVVIAKAGELESDGLSIDNHHVRLLIAAHDLPSRQIIIWLNEFDQCIRTRNRPIDTIVHNPLG